MAVSDIKKIQKSKSPSELRMDLVSNDWVVIATGRSRRPESFSKNHKNKNKEPVSKKDCPFCQKEELGTAIFRNYRQDGSWIALSIPNKYPAFAPSLFLKDKESSYKEILNEKKVGPNRVMDGYGFHEVIITYDHVKPMALFSEEDVEGVIDVYKNRYLALMNQKFIKYVSIFHNHGREAGASVAHPHSQLIAIPIIDPGLRKSIYGAEAFYVSHGECVYCTMLKWEMEDGQRIIYENDEFVVLCPFAPQVSFEVRVYPKKHQPYFENIVGREKKLFADALKTALYKIYKALKNPSYNYYIHTSPCDGANYDFYHWHVNILPKTSVWAGFELSTGIEISTIEPERAAEFLRKF
ncbi:DUF4931 domain-containing protein [Patescibacteria group bacterium]